MPAQMGRLPNRTNANAHGVITSQRRYSHCGVLHKELSKTRKRGSHGHNTCDNLCRIALRARPTARDGVGNPIRTACGKEHVHNAYRAKLCPLCTDAWRCAWPALVPKDLNNVPPAQSHSFAG